MGGVTPGELAAIRERLEAFADNIFESLPRKDQRPSIEPMAQRLGDVH